MSSHLAFKFKTKYDRRKITSEEEAVVENDDEEDELILPERKVVQSRYLQKRPARTLEPAEWEHRDYLAVQAQKERETLRRAMKRTFEASVSRGESYAVLKQPGTVETVTTWNDVRDELVSRPTGPLG